jgi:hypothetical protein
VFVLGIEPHCFVNYNGQRHCREDISLTLKDNVLIVAALKPQTGEEEHGVYFQKERNFGRFYRKVRIVLTR